MKEHPFMTTLASRFGGLLRHGLHTPDGEACALEVASVARGAPWSDDPSSARLPDIRALNDARWPSDEARTAALVPLVLALWDWQEWPPERQRVYMTRVVERTIREVLPIALRAVGLEDAAVRCETEGTQAAARAAARAAEAAARAAGAAARAAGAAGAARAAARAAAWAAAWAAAEEAAEEAAWAAGAAGATARGVLLLACRIWVEEAA